MRAMFLEDCKDHFNTDNLYAVLHIESKTPTNAQIKKAYYKQSMKYHPDKASGDDAKANSTVKFQLISKAYSILCDKEKRALYDETGVVDEENVLSDQESVNLWRSVFKKVTTEDIEKFYKEYKDSEEEESDIIASYKQWNGDIGKIMDSVLCSSYEDEPRIKGIIDRLITEKKLEKTNKYKSSTGKVKAASRKRKAMQEEKEAEEYLEQIKKKEGSDDLEALILRRQSERGSAIDSFCDTLEAKYANKTRRKPNKK